MEINLDKLLQGTDVPKDMRTAAEVCSFLSGISLSHVKFPTFEELGLVPQFINFVDSLCSDMSEVFNAVELFGSPGDFSRLSGDFLYYLPMDVIEQFRMKYATYNIRFIIECDLSAIHIIYGLSPSGDNIIPEIIRGEFAKFGWFIHTADTKQFIKEGKVETICKCLYDFKLFSEK